MKMKKQSVKWLIKFYSKPIDTRSINLYYIKKWRLKKKKNLDYNTLFIFNLLPLYHFNNTKGEKQNPHIIYLII